MKQSEQPTPMALLCAVEADYRTVDKFVINSDAVHKISLPKGAIWISVTDLADGSGLFLIKMFKEVRGKGLEQFESSRSPIPMRIGLPDFGGAFTLYNLGA
jgi:hypothetical protein